MSFDQDLKTGNEAEREWAQVILRDLSFYGGLARFYFNRGIDYDIQWYLLSEVKHDRLEAKTGRIAFEFRNNILEKHAGIYASKAHIVAYKLHDCWFVFDRKQLCQELVDKEELGFITDGGDNGNAKLILFNRYDVEQFESLIRKEKLNEN